MRWVVSLLLLGSFIVSVPALAQLDQLGPSGDFRVNDQSGTAPTVGLPGGPSLSPESALFRDFTGPKNPDEILKSIDKEMGRPTLGGPESPSSGQSIDLDKDLPLSSDKVFK